MNLEEYRDLKIELKGVEDNLDKLERKVDKLGYVLYGPDETNGLRSKVKEILEFLEELKPEHNELWKLLSEWKELKKNLRKIFVCAVVAFLVTTVINCIKLKTNQDNKEILQNIEKSVNAQIKPE